MSVKNDLLVSSSDAEALSSLVGGRRAGGFEADAADELAGALMEARMVPPEQLPADRVAINAAITYLEEPGGEKRTVRLVLPHEAAPSEHRISVLSPVGRALLGRRSGAVAAIRLPGGRGLKLRVLEIEQDRGAASA